MKNVIAGICLCLCANAHAVLPKSTQLDALTARSEVSGKVGRMNIEYAESRCGQLTDKQAAYLLSSDMQYMLTALGSTMPPNFFETLYQEAMTRYECGKPELVSEYIKHRLNLAP